MPRVPKPVSSRSLGTERALAPKRLRDMKNLGAKTEAMLAAVGIVSPEQLLAADPFAVYALLKAQVPGTSVVALYALIGAIDGQHWLDVQKERRTEILLRLDDRGIAPT
jgi:DNA transformation protein and related proteins